MIDQKRRKKSLRDTPDVDVCYSNPQQLFANWGRSSADFEPIAEGGNRSLGSAAR